MKPSAFSDRTYQPESEALTIAMGRTARLWEEIKNYLRDVCGTFYEEWKFPSQKYGWSLRVKHKQRIIIYVVPHEGYFEAAFNLGERAVAAALASKLPESVLEVIRTARKYPEGVGFRMDVKTRADADAVKHLCRIKFEN